jgi:tetratricopeptide (TPR) repeat protein
MWRRLLALILVLSAAPALAAQDGRSTVSADSAYALASAAYEKEDFDRAKDLIERALKQAPDNCEYHHLLGGIQGARAARASIFSKFGTAKSCKQHFERAVELCPDSVEYLQSLLEYHRQAPGIAGGDKKEAARLLERIFVLDSSAGFWIRASIAAEDKDYTLAEGIYQEMLRTGRDTVTVLLALGGLAASQSKDYTRARAFYLRALAADPGNQSVNYQVARLAILSKQNPREAIDRLHDYIAHPVQRNQPDHAAAYWRMGMAYELVGNPDSARLCYQSSLQLRPGYEDAKKALEALGK